MSGDSSFRWMSRCGKWGRIWCRYGVRCYSRNRRFRLLFRRDVKPTEPISATSSAQSGRSEEAEAAAGRDVWFAGCGGSGQAESTQQEVPEEIPEATPTRT